MKYRASLSGLLLSSVLFMEELVDSTAVELHTNCESNSHPVPIAAPDSSSQRVHKRLPTASHVAVAERNVTFNLFAKQPLGSSFVSFEAAHTKGADDVCFQKLPMSLADCSVVQFIMETEREQGTGEKLGDTVGAAVPQLYR
jgi:hypothetical protein